ncbi:MAG: NusG domain II-containing protein [Betaproteobacteria bacterium]|nr:NusG domain II-containing protein [Betaproteobacteria bacterium]
MRWLALVRPGDWLVFAAGVTAVAASLPLLLQGGYPERAIVRQEGRIFAEIDLRSRREVEVPGPLGVTRIAVEPGRARVVSDPGPRQYCVRQGWLARPGEIAICAPNRVSIQITGRTRAYDSLSY